LAVPGRDAAAVLKRLGIPAIGIVTRRRKNQCLLRPEPDCCKKCWLIAK
jgi:hypothetical protein